MICENPTCTLTNLCRDCTAGEYARLADAAPLRSVCQNTLPRSGRIDAIPSNPRRFEYHTTRVVKVTLAPSAIVGLILVSLAIILAVYLSH